MDQHEDAKGPSADQPAPIDATPVVQSGKPEPAEPKDVVAGIEAPSIVPSASEPAIDAPVTLAPTLATKPDEAAATAAASPIKRTSARLGRFAPLAAAVVVGLLAGALGATALPPIGALFSAASGAGAPAAEAPSVSASLAQMRADLAALKSSTEAISRNTNAQLARLSERFDRLERAQAAGKADMVVGKDTSGAIAAPPPSNAASAPPANAAAAPLPPAPVPQPAILSGWVVRDVYRGSALLQGRMGGMIAVGPGDILPGVGRIEAVRRQDGRWVVITAKGMIVSMR
jgi:hypothetical protein